MQFRKCQTLLTYQPTEYIHYPLRHTHFKRHSWLSSISTAVHLSSQFNRENVRGIFYSLLFIAWPRFLNATRLTQWGMGRMVSEI